MTEETVSKETKIQLAKALVCSYVGTDEGKGLKMDEIVELFEKTFDKVEKKFPEPEKKSVGLGV